MEKLRCLTLRIEIKGSEPTTEALCSPSLLHPAVPLRLTDREGSTTSPALLPQRAITYL